jgi:hypothetical protein
MITASGYELRAASRAEISFARVPAVSSVSEVAKSTGWSERRFRALAPQTSSKVTF